MYFHAPCGVVLYSVMLCLYIVECNCNFYEHKKKEEEFIEWFMILLTSK